MVEARKLADAACARPEVRQALAMGDWPVVLRAFLDCGLSQTAVAARAGLSQSQVSRLANGKSHTPGMKTVKALCNGLAIPRRLAGLRMAAARRMTRTGGSSSAHRSAPSRPRQSRAPGSLMNAF
jgi:transcriptional regulator with XRE-family HTH domain